MTASQDEDKKKTLSLSGKKLEIKKTGDSGQIRQSFSHGRSKTVAVEVKRKRVIERPGDHSGLVSSDHQRAAADLGLTTGELENRIRLLQEARERDLFEQQRREQEEQESQRRAELERQAEEQKQKEASMVSGDGVESIAQGNIIPEDTTVVAAAEDPETAKSKVVERKTFPDTKQAEDDADNRQRARSGARAETRKPSVPPRRPEPRTNLHRMAVAALSGDEEDAGSTRYRGGKKGGKKKTKQESFEESRKMVREIIIPEVITVQELSNRMAVRAAEVVKKLMTMGVMATINELIDADTAEIIAIEFGNTPRKVSMADVELGLGVLHHDDEDLLPRAPVVTVMGHVDHGKTSLLDAIRKSDVVSGEAGGITQHIGAYQVTIPSGQKITFIDTPGHAAFSEMRARGANVTDVVVLVVAADDGIMAQTMEAISHAKAANVPIIVAINKIDKPDADPQQVRQELLSHDIVLEEFGGDVMAVEVSAKKNMNIDKLLETILLQAEVLNLRANPHRSAVGVVVEARVERGRGAVATVLIQQGQLKMGDIFVAGAEWGRVRALGDDHGHTLNAAMPSMPAEVLGFNGPPSPGDQFVVVESEARAREVAEFRLHRTKELKAAQVRKSSLEQLIMKKVEGEPSELSVVIKSDVQGSVEAIVSSLSKLATDEVAVKILHTGVGGISESDITLAKASNALVVGFNVRANPQAREASSREGVEIRYYSIIYDVIDDIKAMLGGLLSPTLKEQFLGYASIRDVFNITRVGKIAGCMITEGVVKRGAKVRLLRDNVVIHEGTLKTLKRFKDEVREVREGYECGMAFENYQDIRAGDVIECFEIQEIAREL